MFPNNKSADLNILPPQNIEAEKSLLGSVFLDQDALLKVIDIVTPEDFYKREHGLIFKAFLRLFERGDPIDVVTVYGELEQMKVHEEVGGVEYLIELAEMVPTAAHVVNYAKIVREKALLREMITVATDIVRRCYEPDIAVDNLLDEAEKMIFSISEKRTKTDFSSSREIVKSAIARLEALAERRQVITGIPTGFIDFDRLTAGLQPSDFIIIAGRPSMGKTSFALNIAQNVATYEGKVVAFFTLEMSKEQLALRMLASQARVNFQKLRTGNIEPDDWDKIIRAADVLSEAFIFIDEAPGINVLEMRAKARRLMAEHGLDLIIIDYLQLMRGLRRTENRQQEISEISRALKELAKELNVPVIAISQLSRAVEARQDKRPQLSDLRESGAIEQDADLVLFVYREEVYNPAPHNIGIAEIIIGKQRNGPVGTVKLAFFKEYTRFDNLEEDSLLDDIIDT